MERKEVKTYGKIIKVLFALILFCGSLLTWVAGSTSLAAEKVTLYGILERYPLGEALWKAASEEYTAANLQAEMLPRKTKADKLRILFSSKSPDLDLTIINTSELAEYAPFLEPLNGYMKKYRNEYKFGDIELNALDLLSKEGNVYALPYDLNTNLLFYRKDLFDEAGLSVPKTMDEWLHAVKKLTTNGRKGIAIQLQRPVSTHIGFSYYLWSVGGDYFDKDMNPIFNNEKGIEALELLGKFYQYAPKECLGYWGDELTNSLNQDKAASGLNWITRCAKMDDPKESKVVGKVQFGVPPGIPPLKGSSYNTIAGWAISKFSKNKEETFKLIALLSSEKYGLRFAHMGLSPRGAVMNDPELIKKYRWYPAALQTLKQGKILPSFPEWWEIGDEMAIQIHRYLMGEVSAKAGLDAAAQKARAILKEKGYIK